MILSLVEYLQNICGGKMHTKMRWLLAIAIIAWVPYAQSAKPDEWEITYEKAMTETIKNVRRIDPLLFSSLAVPDDVVNKLRKLGCKIPQADKIHEPHNIINGEFGVKGQTDWAAICSKEPGTSFIVVLWGGKRPCPSEITSSKDSDKEWIRQPVMSETDLIGHYPRNIEVEGYLRTIRTADTSYFLDGDHKTGIDYANEGIVESASVDSVDTNSYYCSKGKWKKWSENAGD